MESTQAAYQREYRRRRKLNGGSRLTQPVVAVAEPEPVVGVPWPSAPAKAVARWSAETLRVPDGHPAAGEALIVPSFFEDFLADALSPECRESGLLVARKSGKSACAAVLILAHLSSTGPLRRPGWRCGVASLSREKSGELWLQCSDIAAASGLKGIRFGRAPKVAESVYGKADFLSSEKSSGHASGYDLVLNDELGLFPAGSGRDLVAGLLSSVSARRGRMMSISVVGFSDLTRELIARKDDPGVVVHLYQAPAGCDLQDEDSWAKANPTLGTIKSVEHMRFCARRAASSPADQSSFRSLELNQFGSPSREPIVALDRFLICSTRPVPERSGPLHIGVDLGGSASLTAASLYFADTGRLEVYAAAGSDPDLATRGQSDGVGDRYERMEELGELKTFAGRVTPTGPFMSWLCEIVGEHPVALVLADRYRQSEMLDAMDQAGVNHWRVEFRGSGAGAHGHEDVRSFQRAIESGSLRPGRSLALASAIRESEVVYDTNANPSLRKARARGRIDPLSASILAIGAGSRAAVPEAEVSYFHIPI